MSGQPVAFDAAPLTDPVDPKAVKEFTAELRRRRSGTSAATVISIVVLVLMVIVIVPVLAMTLFSIASHTTASTASVPFVLIVAIGGAAAFAGVLAWRNSRVKRYRLARFAAANNMTYVERADNPALPGTIFQVGSSRHSRDLVRGRSPRFVEFGNYQYTVKTGKSSTTHRWGYVAVKLDVPLPNIVLDAVGNNSVFGSNLPASFRKDQQLSLEGDFDRYFTLYCPSGYERDALYLFTPDIMARFIDNAAQLDVEIVDDWLFLYTRRPVSTLDPATWSWLFGAVGALTTKLDQWARWRDERLLLERGSDAVNGTRHPVGRDDLPFAAPAGMLTPPPGVARQGRRLRRGVPWLSIALVVVVAAFWMLSKLQ
jgi:hypothetical protein